MQTWTGDDDVPAVYETHVLLPMGVRIRSRLFLAHLYRVLAARVGGGLVLSSAFVKRAPPVTADDARPTDEQRNAPLPVTLKLARSRGK